MVTLLRGSGSTATHALTAASAVGLGPVRVSQLALAVAETGSVEAEVHVTTNKSVPKAELYYGQEGTVAKAITNAGLPGTLRLTGQAMGREQNGSVYMAFAQSTERNVPVVTLLSGTGSTVTHAATTAGITAKTDPRVRFVDLAMDSLGSVTGVWALTTDKNTPN